MLEYLDWAFEYGVAWLCAWLVSFFVGYLGASMAIIKFGPMVVGARGTLDGITFSANKSGPYAKPWAKGGNPRTQIQTENRARFSTFASGWRDLSTVNKDDWDDYADDAAQQLTNSLAETYFISGFNWYIRINDHLDRAARAPRTAAPNAVRPAAPTIDSDRLGVTGSGLTTLISVDITDPDFGADVAVLSTMYVSQGRLVDGAPREVITIEQPNAAGTINLTTPVITRYGDIQLGQRIFWFIAYQDTEGQRGPFSTLFSDSEE